MQGRPHGRSRHSRSHGPRNILVAAALVLTVAVGGWYFVLRGSGEPSGDFLRAEHSFVDAAREIPVAAANVQRMLDLPAFDKVFDSSIAEMQAQLAVFDRLSRDEEGQARSVAKQSASFAQIAVTSAQQFRTALFRSRVSDAKSAKDQLEGALAALEENSADWKKL
jgi:hypothetical protein